VAASHERIGAAGSEGPLSPSICGDQFATMHWNNWCVIIASQEKINPK
jgi:hypothetical protein